MLLFPALIAEKILLSLYLVFLPITFRFLAKAISTKGTYIQYFVFPFTYSYLFYYGFYNFHLGMIFLFLTIGLWLKYSQSYQINVKHFSILVLLSLLIYFSHLFVYVIFLAVVSLLTIFKVFTQPFSKVNILNSLKKPLILFAPGVILMIIYLYTHKTIPEDYSNLANYSQSWFSIQNIEPAKGVEYGTEGIFTKWIFILFVIIVCNLLIIRIKNFKAAVNQKSIIWGIISAGLLISFFVFPNGSTFIRPRLLVFFFLFFILFITTQKVNVWVRVISFVVINYMSAGLLVVYIESASDTNNITHDIIEASEHIEPFSTVLPINDSDFWLMAHSSNYLGINKPMVILENYEASTNYFPLIWNRNKLPFLHLGETDQTQVNYPHNKNNFKSQIDYVLVISNINTPKKKGKNEKEINELLEKYYELTYITDSHSVKLYRKTPAFEGV